MQLLPNLMGAHADKKPLGSAIESRMMSTNCLVSDAVSKSSGLAATASFVRDRMTHLRR
jgi:hypothetical protein